MPKDTDDELSILEKQVDDLTKQLNAAVEASKDVKKAADSELQKQLDELIAKMEELEDENALLKAWGDMSSDEKDHCKGMSPEDKAKFSALTPEERKSKMKKVADADEVITVAGREMRKSVVGVDAFEIVKAQAAQIAKNEADIAKERDARITAELAKRADAEYAHVPGTVDERANILKAISTMDEPLRKSFEAVLTQSEKLAAAGFARLGHKGGKEPEGSDVGKAAANFEGKISEIRARDKSTRTAALAKARVEYPDLFKAYQDVDVAKAAFEAKQAKNGN